MLAHAGPLGPGVSDTRAISWATSGPCWSCVELCGTYVEPCVEPMLRPCWVMLVVFSLYPADALDTTSSRRFLGAMLGPCWAHVRPLFIGPILVLDRALGLFLRDKTMQFLPTVANSL